ncbi:unnamed protein product [Effrenium voratum]|nr:unnamed protein product [Effrenium voratum]
MGEIESMVGTAREGIAGAREQLAGERIESVEVEEDIKEDFQAFLQEEAKRSEMCLGQLERRLGRVQNLVANYQRDIQRERNKQTIEELKPQILEQAQALDFAAAEAEVSKAIKAAEEASSPSKKLELMTVEELQAAMEQMTQKVADAESSLKSIEEQICPVEDQDELVKKALQKYVLSQMKSVGSKLSFLQQRLARPKEALEKCRQLIRKKESFRIKSLQVKAMKLMDIFREDQAGKGLEGLPSTDIFRVMDSDGDGLISKEEFIQFFLDLEPLLEDKQQHLKASLEDLERLFSFGLGKEQGLTLQGMEKLVIRFMKVVRPTPLTKNLQVVPGETLRELQLGELLEVLGGPQQSSQKLPRVMCRAKGQVGWATISGNVGTVFLRDFQPE